MEDKDIIGKTFTAFKFNSTIGLHYSSQYKESFGKKAKVIHLHHNLPYAYCSIKISPTTEIQNFYPIKMIKEQFEGIEKEQNQSIDDILNEIKQLTSKL
jgi:hypothetical protein